MEGSGCDLGARTEGEFVLDLQLPDTRQSFRWLTHQTRVADESAVDRMIDQSRAECSAAKGGDDCAVAARDENTERVAQVLFRHVRLMTKREVRTGHVHGTSGCSVPSASTMVPKASGVHQGASSAWTRWTERR